MQTAEGNAGKREQSLDIIRASLDLCQVVRILTLLAKASPDLGPSPSPCPSPSPSPNPVPVPVPGLAKAVTVLSNNPSPFCSTTTATYNSLYHYFTLPNPERFVCQTQRVAVESHRHSSRLVSVSSRPCTRSVVFVCVSR
jgi:hypothetical protein